MSTDREFTLFRGVHLFTPEAAGEADLLVGETVLASGDLGGLAGLPGCHVERLPGALVTPGFVDLHVHVAGAGGEGGFTYRTPPVAVADLVAVGTTAVVGLLGTDGVTRTALALLAEVRRLQAAGIAAYMFSGAYWVPARTVTDSLRSDLVVVPEVLGAGEIAVSDPRGSDPEPPALALLAREVYVGALLAGKRGLLHVHLGDEPQGLAPVFEAWRRSRLPIRLFHPTHLNRRPALLEEAIAFAREGGRIDLTAGIAPAPGDPEPVAADEGVAALRGAGVPLDRITVSSDANGSSPVFAPDGRLSATTVIHPRVLLDTFRRLADAHALADALLPVTANPAAVLGLEQVGRIRPGALAHLLVFDDRLELRRVYLKGTLAFADGEVRRSGPYEERRSASRASASRYARDGSPRATPGS